MATPKELEIKLAIAPKSLRILEKLTYPSLRAARKDATEVSVYFDIPKRNLHKKRLLLRVRRIGDGYTRRRDGKPPGATPGGSRSVGDRLGGRGCDRRREFGDLLSPGRAHAAAAVGMAHCASVFCHAGKARSEPYQRLISP